MDWGKTIGWGKLQKDTKVRITSLRGKYLLEAGLSGSSLGYREPRRKPIEYFPLIRPWEGQVRPRLMTSL